MVTIWILVALCLAACGVILICATEKAPRRRTVRRPPPLPPRDHRNTAPPPVARPQTGTRGAAPTRPLPPRRVSASATVNAAANTVRAGSGPRGLQPHQFPCCPMDKSRNVPGMQQLIFWDSGKNCYRCSRGHRFRSNGRPL